MIHSILSLGRAPFRLTSNRQIPPFLSKLSQTRSSKINENLLPDITKSSPSFHQPPYACTSFYSTSSDPSHGLLSPVFDAYVEYKKSQLLNAQKEMPNVNSFEVHQEIEGVAFTGAIPNICSTLRLNHHYLDLQPSELTFYWAQTHGLNLSRLIPLAFFSRSDASFYSQMMTPELEPSIIKGAHGPSIEVPYLLPTNADLLAALTAPGLNREDYDTYRKLLAWLYIQDDLIVDRSSRTDQDIEADIIKQQDCLHYYQQIMENKLFTPPNDPLVSTLVSLFQDVWTSLFRSIDKFSDHNATLINDIQDYMKHGIKELEYLNHLAIHGKYDSYCMYDSDEAYLHNRDKGGGVQLSFEALRLLSKLPHQEDSTTYQPSKNLVMWINDATSVAKEVLTKSKDNIVILRRDWAQSNANISLPIFINRLSLQLDFNKSSDQHLKEITHLMGHIRHQANASRLGLSNHERELWEQSFHQTFSEITSTLRQLEQAPVDPWIQWATGYLLFEKLSNRHATQPDPRSVEQKEIEKWRSYLLTADSQPFLEEIEGGYSLNCSFLGVTEISLGLIISHLKQTSCLDRVIELNLSCCDLLDSLPPNISTLSALQHLKLGLSSIQRLPECVTSLSQLSTIDITGCSQLDNLPANLSRLKHLNKLVLRGCPLNELKEHVKEDPRILTFEINPGCTILIDDDQNWINDAWNGVDISPHLSQDSIDRLEFILATTEEVINMSDIDTKIDSMISKSRLLMAKEDNEASIQCLQKVLDLLSEPTDDSTLDHWFKTIVAYGQLTDLYSFIGDHNAALKCVDKSLNLILDIPAKPFYNYVPLNSTYNIQKLLKLYEQKQIRKAFVLEQLGQYDSSLQILSDMESRSKLFLDDVTRLDSDDGYVFYNLGRLNIKLGRYKKAFQYFERDLKISLHLQHTPDVIASAYVQMGEALRYQEKFSEAEEYYHLALDNLNKISSNHSHSAGIYNNLGELYRMQGDFNKALGYYNKAIPLHKKFNNLEQLSGVYSNMGIIYSKLDNTQQSLSLLHKALSCSPSSDSKITIYINMASEYLNLGEYSKGLEYVYQSISLTKQHLGKLDPRLSHAYYLQAILLGKGSQFDEALASIKKAISLEEESTQRDSKKLSGFYYFGHKFSLKLNLKQDADYYLELFGKEFIKNSDRNKLENSLDNDNDFSPAIKQILMAMYLFAQKEFYSALDHCETALQFLTTSDEKDDYFLALNHQLLGTIHQELNNWDKVPIYANKGLSALDPIFDPNDSDHTKVYQYCYALLGHSSHDLGHYEDAIQHYEKSLQYPHLVNGSNIDIYRNLGISYRKAGRFDESTTVLKKAIKLNNQQYGEAYCALLTALGNTLISSDSSAEAKTVFEQVEQQIILEKGSDNIDLASVFVGLGNSYLLLKNLDQALEYHQKALEIFSRHYGDFHPEVAISNLNIGNIMFKQKKDVALDHFKTALRIRTSFYGQNHPEVGVVLFNIGSFYGKKENYHEAIKYFEQSSLIFKDSLAPNHPKLGDVFLSLGKIYGLVKDLDSARKNLVLAEKIFQSNKDLSRVIEARTLLAILYKLS